MALPRVPMLPGETLGQFKRLSAHERGRRTDERWALQQVQSLPMSWQERLLHAHGWNWKMGPDPEHPEWGPVAANLALLGHCATLEKAQRAGIPADASDGDIVQRAKDGARDALRRRGLAAERWRGCGPVVELSAVVWALSDWLDSIGLGQEWAATLRRAYRGRTAIARACCERWWRRVLRRIHAQASEGTARALGLVSKRAGCYASDDAVRRHRGRVVSTAAMLERTEAVNDQGQRHALAELAAKGPSDKQIRRMELMTRIAGFEVICRDMGHVAAFVTVTCPSRMHAVITKGKHGYGVRKNPKHDGTLPGAAQRHLSEQWQRFRAAADRIGLGQYGFRIAEPNHDGTPHWHMILFMPKRPGVGMFTRLMTMSRAIGRQGRWLHWGNPICLMERMFRDYFLCGHDGTERGAIEHRVKVETIDWAKGSAASYVAKYVSKNIDGYRVEKDLYGNEALTASMRVEAWASHWRIRQFQQIGGAPVGIWRELRRLHTEQTEAAPAMAAMLEAVNVTAMVKAASDGVRQYTAAHGWASYQELQGGPRTPRRLLRVRLMREQSGELGQYGDVMPPRTIGVETVDVRREVVQPFGAILRPYVRPRDVTVRVESERSTWIVVPREFAEQAIERIKADQARAARPWSPVNNCTAPAPAPLFGPAVERHRKRGLWVNWSRGGEQSTPERGNHERNDEREPGPAW